MTKSLEVARAFDHAPRLALASLALLVGACITDKFNDACPADSVAEGKDCVRVSAGGAAGTGGSSSGSAGAGPKAGAAGFGGAGAAGSSGASGTSGVAGNAGASGHAGTAGTTGQAGYSGGAGAAGKSGAGGSSSGAAGGSGKGGTAGAQGGASGSGGAAGVCSAGPTKCVGPAFVATCQADGTYTMQACPANAPVCAGGVCGCANASQCPAPAGECVVATCNGTCGTAFAPMNTPLKTQTDHDCIVTVCDGNGGTSTLAEPSDVPLDDGNPCTDETCNVTTPAHPFSNAGKMCGAGFCNGAGICGVCKPGDGRCVGNSPETCNASGSWSPASDCGASTPVCSAGACVGVKSAAAGSGTCVLLDDGTVRCWGMKVNGVFATTPTPVTGVTMAVDVAVAQGFVCVARSVGPVLCWGANDSGQLGQGVTGPASDVPQSVSGTDGAVQVSAGFASACAVRGDGSVVCWGDNGAGQLGHDTGGANVLTPTPVALPKPATHVSISGSHGCAVLADATAVCWGYNSGFVVGMAGGIVSPVVARADVSHVAVGAFFTCVRYPSSGVECVGDIDGGAGVPGVSYAKWTTVGVADVLGVSFSDICATAVGAVKCWGRDDAGQVGDGSTNAGAQIQSPKTVAGLGASSWVTAGTDGAACAKQVTGALLCWGKYVGDGSATVKTPTAVVW